MDHLCHFCLGLLCFHASLFFDALWSPAGKNTGQVGLGLSRPGLGPNKLGPRPGPI